MSIQTLKDEAKKKRETIIFGGTFEFETLEDWQEFVDLLGELSRPVLFIDNTITTRDQL